MRFKLTLLSKSAYPVIPVNYQYPLSAVIYRILSSADQDYAAFLHDAGYQKKGSLKSFKFFTFSDIRTPFKITGDRLQLTTPHAEVEVRFHLPQAAENFIKGLFMQQQLDIADKKSKARFDIQSVESLPDPLQAYKPQELINIVLKPLSPVVAGVPVEKGKYEFLSPEDIRFTESLLYNWRSKIAVGYDENTASSALLMMEVIPIKISFKSRLITIKAYTPEETKIRGWMNFGLKVTGEKRFAELLLNAGTGIYNSQGMGCLEIVT